MAQRLLRGWLRVEDRGLERGTQCLTAIAIMWVIQDESGSFMLQLQHFFLDGCLMHVGRSGPSEVWKQGLHCILFLFNVCIGWPRGIDAWIEELIVRQILLSL